MFTLKNKVDLMKMLGLVVAESSNDSTVKELLKPVDGVTIYVACNNHKIMPATTIVSIELKEGGYFFTIGNNESYKLKSDNFVVKHDDDYLNLELALFGKSMICQQNNPYHSLAS